MKSLITIAILLAIFAAFLWFCKLIDPSFTINGLIDRIDNALSNKPTTQPTQSTQTYQGKNLLYRQCQGGYENFATIVWSCLKRIGGICGLAVPAYANNIYSAETMTRVDLVNGQYIFTYEVGREVTRFEGGLKAVKAPSTEEIANALLNNLPDYLCGGYYFTGNICVWDIDKTRVRIEIYGVNRDYQLQGDIII